MPWNMLNDVHIGDDELFAAQPNWIATEGHDAGLLENPRITGSLNPRNTGSLGGPTPQPAA